MKRNTCWEYHRCSICGNCPAYPEHGSDCWNVEGTLCSGRPRPLHSEICKLCVFYQEEYEASFLAEISERNEGARSD